MMVFEFQIHCEDRKRTIYIVTYEVIKSVDQFYDPHVIILVQNFYFYCAPIYCFCPDMQQLIILK